VDGDEVVFVTESGGVPVPGVRELEHTADVGLEIRAPDLPQLFRRAALGAMWLVLERDVEDPGSVPAAPEAEPFQVESVPGGIGDSVWESRTLELVEADLPALLRSWLRALLFWEETEGFVVVDAVVALLPAPLCSSPTGQAFGLRGQVRGRLDGGPRVREIKGVTLHGLEVRDVEGAWIGRVIFDV
jgi:SHS2 domain-containing protein